MAIQKYNKESIAILENTSLNKVLEKQLIFYRPSKEVKQIIDIALTNCIKSIGIELSDDVIFMLVNDIHELYKYETLEDILICLKNGRQGKYGTTYNKFNLIIFKEWMSKHLEEKSIIREHENNKHKHDWKTRDEYIESIAIGFKNQFQIKKAIESANKRELEYQKFRDAYIREQQKKSKQNAEPGKSAKRD